MRSVESPSEQERLRDGAARLRRLPAGWEGPARTLGALTFGRRFTPQSLLRTRLIDLSEDCSMREAAQRVRHGERAEISDVGLLKGINQSVGWIGARRIEASPLRGPAAPSAGRPTDEGDRR